MLSRLKKRCLAFAQHIVAGGVKCIAQFAFLFKRHVPRLVFEVGGLDHVIGLGIPEDKGYFFKQFHLIFGEILIIEPLLGNNLLKAFFGQFIDGCSQIRGHIAGKLLEKLPRHRSHLPGEIVQTGNGPSRLFEMLKIKEIQKLEELRFPAIPGVRREIDNGVNQLFSMVCDNHIDNMGCGNSAVKVDPIKSDNYYKTVSKNALRCQ